MATTDARTLTGHLCTMFAFAGKRLRDDRGAVTVMFAIFGSLIVCVFCMALSWVFVAEAKARAQDARDITDINIALEVNRITRAGMTPDAAQLQKDGQAYFRANMPTGLYASTIPDANITVSVTGSSTAGFNVTTSVSGQIQLLLPVIAGNHVIAGTMAGMPAGSTGPDHSDFVNIGGTSTVYTLPKSTLELVMVLDNTGSMADQINGQSKLQGLQQAANTLISDVFASTNASAYIGLVPFTTTVNLTGALPATGSWLSPRFAYNNTNVGMTASDNQDGWGGCAVEPRDSNGYLYAKPYGITDPMKFTPYYYNVPQGGLTVRTYRNSLCNGTAATSSIPSVPMTVQGGGDNYCGYNPPQTGNGIAVVYDAVSGSPSSRQTVRQNTDCISNPVTFLTTDQTTLSSAISRMKASGSTIIPTGILWGWRMLSSSWADSVSPGNGWISTVAAARLPLPETTAGLQRVMIVLTDGENQVGGQYAIPNDLYFNSLSGVGTNSLSAPGVMRTDGTTLANGLMDSSELTPLASNGVGNSADINTFQVGVCTAIKNSGITIYSITFGSVSSVAAATMRSCATPGDYYHAPNGATLNSIFQEIAGNLGVLRLVQ
ncbi:VWA domain-containing protein [Paraburkholderia sediminicola]|uniref:VWA domain-containing protein n=1 Tax=Paraburkholderia sediminicola TaxID=458836 RepID=UPI0038BD23A1